MLKVTKSDKVNALLSILYRTDMYIIQTQILSELNISRRTMFNRIDQCNKSLAKIGLDKIVSTPKMGYTLTLECRKQLSKYNVINEDVEMKSLENNQVNRIDQIIILLLMDSNELSINKLSQRFSVSRNTIIHDFKKINIDFSELNIINTPTGKKLVTDEYVVREFILKQLQNKSEVFFCWIEGLQVVKGFDFRDMQRTVNMKFTGTSMDILNAFVVACFYRISIHKTISSAKVDEKLIPYIYTVQKYFELLFNENNLDLSKNQLSKETALLAKVTVCLPMIIDGNVNKRSVLYKRIQKITAEMIFKYENLIGEKFNTESFWGLLTNHVVTAYFRVVFNVPFESNEIELIKKNYPKLIGYTAISCAPLEEYLEQTLPENEVALICLYFGAAERNLESESVKDLFIPEKIKTSAEADALIVCSSGIGTSVMLLHELSKSFPMIKFSSSLEIGELRDVLSLKNRAQMVITTVPIEDNEINIPVVQVRPVLSAKNYERVHMELRKKFPSLFHDNNENIDMLLGAISKYANIHDEEGLRNTLIDYMNPKINEDKLNIANDTLGINDVIDSTKVEIIDNLTVDWKTVVQNGCQLLGDAVDPIKYSNKIIELVNMYGPYMLIHKKIMLAHAGVKDGVNSVGLAAVLSRHPVKINVKDQIENISLFLVLSPGINKEHDHILEQLIDLIRDEKRLDLLLNSESKKDIIKNITLG